MISLTEIARKVVSKLKRTRNVEEPCCEKPNLNYERTDTSRWEYIDSFRCLNCGQYKFQRSPTGSM